MSKTRGIIMGNSYGFPSPILSVIISKCKCAEEVTSERRITQKLYGVRGVCEGRC